MYRARFRFASLTFLGGSILLASVLLSAGAAEAATRTVSNCNDSGAGSLRNAIAGALSGDTIDLSRLSCSRITLTGTIAVPQADLELVGRSRYALTIDGNRNGRVFDHTGTGTLRVRHLSIANGRTASNVPYGGCIQSLGTVELIRARLHHCTALYTGSLDPQVVGGGLFALRDVLLSYSAVFSNSVPEGPGGGVGAGGNVVLYRSQVYANSAGSDGGGIWAKSARVVYSLIHGNSGGFGGGLHVFGGTNVDDTTVLEINKSTLAANSSYTSGGGLHSGGFTVAVIVDSSIVDNTASSFAAADFSYRTRIFNSTLAYNRNETNSLCTGAIDAVPDLTLVSTIVSGNTCNLAGDLDIWGLGSDVQGSDNLIGRANVPVPSDTISATDPRLAPLADNGGPTRTRMPLADSPALERGSNPLNRDYDQRGPGFPRIRGAFPDIGAVER
jgi:hypothetical protein